MSSTTRSQEGWICIYFLHTFDFIVWNFFNTRFLPLRQQLAVQKGWIYDLPCFLGP